MSAALSKPSMTRPSLYAAVKLARLVQRLKGLLMSFIKICVPSVESCRLPAPAKLKTYGCKTSHGYVVALREGDNANCLVQRH